METPGMDRSSRSQSVRQPQKLKKCGPSGTKRKRRRLERLMVLYGPNMGLRKEVADKFAEEYHDNVHYPPVVTTLPSDNTGPAMSTIGHRLQHVDARLFEKMVSEGDLVCYYHVFDSAFSPDLLPATEGECTAASATEDTRQSAVPNAECASTASSLSKVPSATAICIEDAECEERPRSDSANSVTDMHRTSVPTINTQGAQLSPHTFQRSASARMAHPPLAERRSAPGGISCVAGSISSLRHTFYFGITRRALHEAFQDPSGGVVMLLLPYIAAQQLLSWSRGKFPNAFVACYEKRITARLLRSEHSLLTDASSDSINLLHATYDMVAQAQKFDKITYVEALAYFQSRQFLLERKTAAEGGVGEPSMLTASKIRVDRCLKPEKDLVVTVAGCGYNAEDPFHLCISRTLYAKLTKLGGSCPTTGKHWSKIGCKDDGSTGVDGGGLVAYMHLLHLINTDGLQGLVVDIFHLSEGGKNFNFIEVSAKITNSVLLALHTSYFQKICNQRQQIFGVLNDLYAGALLKFYELFQSATATPDVTAVLADVDGDIRNHCRRLMVSVERHFQGYSFHAQVSTPTGAQSGVSRSTSLTNVNSTKAGSSSSSDSFGPASLGSQKAAWGRSCPNVPQATRQSERGLLDKSMSNGKYLGSSSSVFS
ncbi:uncharacterized protein LOC135815483 [Sycon ciliatum]|uniref:uncharacterized protein LOC135815483 n=1 Tax=Sycon ciliatum TaxID=27933 RepID=UPI0031F66C2D